MTKTATLPPPVLGDFDPQRISNELLAHARANPKAARVIKWFAFDGQWTDALPRDELIRLFGADAVLAAVRTKALRTRPHRLVEVNFADEEVDPSLCPACSGPGEELGTLGRTTRYRCRNCGLVW